MSVRDNISRPSRTNAPPAIAMAFRVLLAPVKASDAEDEATPLDDELGPVEPEVAGPVVEVEVPVA